MDQQSIKEELLYFKKKACELEIELERKNRIEQQKTEKKENTKQIFGMGGFGAFDQSNNINDNNKQGQTNEYDLDFDHYKGHDFFCDKGNRNLTTTSEKNKKKALEKLFTREYKLKKYLFHWIEAARGLNHGNTKIIPYYYFLKWRLVSKGKVTKVSDIHKDLDNSFLDSRWNDHKNELAKENRFPYSKIPKNAISFENEVIDWERELVYKRRFKSLFTSIFRNCSRKLKVFMVLCFYK